MNYRKYDSVGELTNAALKGVHKEWLAPDFLSSIEQPFEFLFASSRNAGDTNYCPAPENIFHPLKILKPEDVKVVLVAQDPYPRLADAIGIAFQAGKGVKTQSVASMKKSLVQHGLECDLGEGCKQYNLIPWVRQGVLLLNVTFTTIEGESGSHKQVWEGVADSLLAQIPRKSVALLLGGDAKAMTAAVRSDETVEHIHPTARGMKFWTKNVFGETNACLVKLGHKPIDWRMHD